ncbi:MAG: T9SS type A sorting domain-containing protein [Calditrichaeota bacterium]|nr:T9SS type A sorting domain-containing protein [Calditrichota bacterium]
MLRTILLFVIVVLCCTALANAASSLQKVPLRGPVSHNLLDDGVQIQTPLRAVNPLDGRLDEALGLVDTAGTTYYDWQHNGTAGKMIAVDAEGYVHLAWTKALDPSYSQRYVYYNVWDPVGQEFLFGQLGCRIDASTRAGFVTGVVNDLGFFFPTFHQIATGDLAHSAGAIDYAAYADAFTTTEIPYLYEGGSPRQIIFPHVAMDIHGDLHTANYDYGNGRMFYAKGTPIFDQDGFGLDIDWGEFQLVDTLYFITQDMATSRHSERVAMAWLARKEGDMGGGNIYIMVSEDAGANWGEPINVTNFTPPDVDCHDSGGDMDICNRDTLRPWLDLSILFDENDFIHLAWTSVPWLYWDEDGNEGPWTYRFASQIYHWGEDRQEYNIVADAWYGNNGDPESNSYNCNRPSLAVDPLTDYLYCSYQLFDTIQYSEAGYPMADAWVTVSTNNGRTWAVATNASRSDGGMGTPAPGSRSERDITLAPLVVDGFLHMEYVLDLDAGASPFGGGVPTLNPVIYQRIPVDSIPTSPVIDPCRNLRVDSTGFPWDLCGDFAERTLVEAPAEFLLYQNYPNPFNSATTIQFDLTRPMPMTLKIYNCLGQEVAALLDEARLSAGVHKIGFDSSNLPSGIYIYRLSGASLVAARKMVLLK